MTFNQGARLDPDQVTDVRGRSFGGGRGLAIGGGGVGLVIAIVYLLLGGDPGALVSPAAGPVTGPAGSQLTQECQTGEDANQRADCRIVGFVNSIQAYWTEAYEQDGGRYQPAQTVLFDGGVDTGCGNADLGGRPVLLPARPVGLPRPRLLRRAPVALRRVGRPAGRGLRRRTRVRPPHREPRGPADRRGRRNRRREPEPSGRSSWPTASPASGSTTRRSTGFLQPPTNDQVADALSAAAAVGDDRIQERTQGQVDPEGWTHGSAEQRQHWFTVGYESGRPAACDTFSGPI